MKSSCNSLEPSLIFFHFPKYFRLGFLLVLLFLQIPCVSAEPIGTSKNPLRMMFVPSGDAQVIVKGGQEIAKLLQKETGLYFKTSVATSYAAVIEAMGAGKVDIGWLAQSVFLLCRRVCFRAFVGPQLTPYQIHGKRFKAIV